MKRKYEDSGPSSESKRHRQQEIIVRCNVHPCVDFGGYTCRLSDYDVNGFGSTAMEAIDDAKTNLLNIFCYSYGVRPISLNAMNDAAPNHLILSYNEIETYIKENKKFDVYSKNL